MRHVRRSGRYLRVADPGWEDPLDGAYAARFGGRFNPPGSFPVCYLNRDLPTARANARHLLRQRLQGLPLFVDDLETTELPVLVGTDVGADDFVDVVTDEGCTELGLPVSYPLDASGEVIPWSVCRPIGLSAWDAGEAGIACRSAAEGTQRDGEELAWFQRDQRLAAVDRRRFEDWYGPIDW